MDCTRRKIRHTTYPEPREPCTIPSTTNYAGSGKLASVRIDNLNIAEMTFNVKPTVLEQLFRGLLSS